MGRSDAATMPRWLMVAWVLLLLQRITVAEQGWISGADFSTAVAFGYVTPGPVLITATFIGYRAGGVPGAIVATIGDFIAPCFFATGSAHLLGVSSGSMCTKRNGR